MWGTVQSSEVLSGLVRCVELRLGLVWVLIPEGINPFGAALINFYHFEVWSGKARQGRVQSGQVLSSRVQ